MAKPKTIGDLIAVKILKKDIRRIEQLRIHKTEPRWSVIERAINNLASKAED